MKNRFIKRIFDIFFSICVIIILFPIYILIALIIKFSSKGPILFWSERVGYMNKNFLMPKFRTMIPGTKLTPTQFFKDKKNITSFGKFLRNTSLDEIPQFYLILVGKMSVVGPRPALYNQKNLIKFRNKKKIYQLKPGLTGLAQISGRDQISISKKVYYDQIYLKNMSVYLDIKIIFLTIFTLFKNIKH